MDERLLSLVDQLDQQELMELNRFVVDRLRFLVEQEARKAARAFCVGDEVEFQADCGHRVRGYVLRTNRKTITVENPNGHWRVPPSLLRRSTTSPQLHPHSESSSVIDISSRLLLDHTPERR